MSKILERAVKSQLYSYLEENGLLYTQQSGFRSKRSTSIKSQFMVIGSAQRIKVFEPMVLRISTITNLKK